MNFWSHERILFLVLVLRSVCIWHYADKSLFLNNCQCSQSLVFVPNPRPYRDLNTSCNVNRSVVCCRYIWPRSLCRRCIYTVGDRAFYVAAVRTWSILPRDVTWSASLPASKHVLAVAAAALDNDKLLSLRHESHRIAFLLVKCPNCSLMTLCHLS